jgi:hypothetical protein
MSTLLIILLLPLSVFVERPADPSPGPWQGRQEARNLECSRLTQQQAHELRPDLVAEPFARGGFALTDALACRRRFLDLDERPARDELILSSLRESVGEITRQAAARGLDGLTWHVDAFYPEPSVARKISVAARVDLAERGQRVSDRVPLLAAGDLVVLAGLPPNQAYPLACARYFAQRSLGESDAFLGLMIVDPREAQLHAGLCVKGDWTWLR